jgi:hypothetical protein
LVFRNGHLDGCSAVLGSALAEHSHRWVVSSVAAETLGKFGDPLVDVAAKAAAPQFTLWSCHVRPSGANSVVAAQQPG